MVSKRSVIPSLVFLLALTSSADTLRATVRVSPAEVTFTAKNGYRVPSLPDAVYKGTAGAPELPCVVFTFVLPPGARVEIAEVFPVETVELAGTHSIRPIQEPRPLSDPGPAAFTAPDERIYSSDTPFPARPLHSFSSGTMCGIGVARVAVSPFQYKPRSGKLRLMTEATIRLRYEKGRTRPETMSERQFRAFSPLVKTIAANPGGLEYYRPYVRNDGDDDVNYAVVTDESLLKAFDSFKLWKTKKGYKTGLFSTSWIYGKYSGNDNAEKIRNFLIDYKKNRGLVYCLLAGDVDKVPHRNLTVMTSPFKKDVASDYYYGDLDGSWDADNDHVYGEFSGDLTCDGYYDIFAGRAPVDNAADVATFIKKDTLMEKHPPAAGSKKLLLPSMPLIDPGYHGREISDAIAAKAPAGWFTAKIEPKIRSVVIDSMNSGYSLCHFAAHGLWYGMGWKSDTMLFINDVPKLTNSNQFPVLFSIACLIGFFDTTVDCITEALLNAPNGGCVAAMTNSREGMSEGSVNGGTEAVVIRFATEFFQNNRFELGKCFVAAKHHFHTGSWKSSDLFGYMVSTSLNCFGDPDLPMYKETPVALAAAHAAAINKGQQNFTVTVNRGASPVSGALVCCYKDGEVHRTDTTNASGQATLSINPASNGTMYVTATAIHCTPYEGACAVGGTGSANEPAPIAAMTGVHSIGRTGSRAIAILYTISDAATVSVEIFDGKGRLLISRNRHIASPGKKRMTFDGSFAKGIYFIRFSAGDCRDITKWVIAD